MTTLGFAERVAVDVERISRHLKAHEVPDIPARIAEIFDGLAVLQRHPLVGRRVAGGQRELVIGRGARCYVALYSFDPMDDKVTIAAFRAQREAGFDER